MFHDKGLAVKELHRVCEYCKITGKDSEDTKNKTRRALVTHIVKFCEREDFLEREDEGMSVLLELNDTLDALREDPAETDAAGAAPLFSSPAAEEGEEETARSAQPASGRQDGDHRPLPPSQETSRPGDSAGREESKQRQRLH